MTKPYKSPNLYNWPKESGYRRKVMSYRTFTKDLYRGRTPPQVFMHRYEYYQIYMGYYFPENGTPKKQALEICKDGDCVYHVSDHTNNELYLTVFRKSPNAD